MRACRVPLAYARVTLRPALCSFLNSMPLSTPALLEEGSAGRAYLLKERVSDPEQLVRAIREVARGGSVIDPKVVETLVAALGELVPERDAAPAPVPVRPA